MIIFCGSLVLAMIGGVLLTFVFLPSLKDDFRGLLLLLFIGSGLGIGLASCLYFCCLLAGRTEYVPIVDLAVCLILGCIGFFSLKRRDAWGRFSLSSETGKKSKTHTVLIAVFSVELFASVGSFILTTLKEPHGRWDAWLIWNMHARFLYRSGETWRAAFNSGMDWSQWDYPLMLPLSIVRSWKYMGHESLYVPAAYALLFTLVTVGLLLFALSFLRGPIHGYLAAMILLGTPFFIFMGAAQFADIPFAFFMLATFVLLFLPTHSPEQYCVAGIAAGLCAWTKNEGLLFLLLVMGSLFCAAAYADGWRPALKKTGRFLAGTLPFLIIFIYFKIRLSGPSYLMEGFSLAAVSEKLLDFSRYAKIAKAFFIMVFSFTQGLVDVRVGMRCNPGAVSILLLIGYCVLVGIRVEKRDRIDIIQAATVLLLMLTGFFFIYVITPLDLNYHLSTSLNRLLLLLWPSVVFLFFMAAGPPETARSGREEINMPHKTSTRWHAKGRKPGKHKEPK